MSEPERRNMLIERQAAMQKMRDDGATLREIGEVFGVTHQRVDQILKKQYNADYTRIDIEAYGISSDDYLSVNCYESLAFSSA